MSGLEDSSNPQTLVFLKTTLALTVVLALGSLLLPGAGEPIFHRVERALSQFASRTTRSVTLLCLMVLGIRLLLLPLLPVPIPGIHDEFSYLLMADTLAHGRLANPPHPMWVSFESFHINWLPTYSSKYPPAQGAVLALGEFLGHPWIGALLAAAAMCAAILWALEAWLPARWAFLAASLAALKLGIASYWMNSYWGGAVAGIGGALVIGALGRIVKQARGRDALLLGLGIAILANSRPYEGFLLCLPAAAVFFWWLTGKSKSPVDARSRVRVVVIPLVLVLFLTAAFMGYYNWRLTGDPLLLPHVLHSRTYDTAPLFLWQHSRPPLHYRNQQFEDFYNGWARNNYTSFRDDGLRVSIEKIFRNSVTYLWGGALLLLPAVPWVFRDARMRFFLIAASLVLAGTLLLVWSNPHYASPITCVLYALLVQAVRHLRTFRISRWPIGRALSRAVVLTLLLDTGISVARGFCDPLWWPCTGDSSRAEIAEKLQRLPGKHLVIVRYGQDHNVHDEWVYNGAEIDRAKILWARELDPAQNARLFAYFKDRQIWLVTPDSDNTMLAPYAPEATSPRSSHEPAQ